MLLLSYIWPIALVIICNTVYQVCAKSVPAEINPLASLTVTYLVAAIMSGLLYIWLGERVDFLGEYRKLNWAPFVLGAVIVGLEAGWMYAYKAGWPVSTALHCAEFGAGSGAFAGGILAVSGAIGME